MQGTEENPVHMKIMADEHPGRFLMVLALSLVPVAAAIWMQSPALRQKVQMTFWHDVHKLAAGNAARWTRLESIARTRYDIARL